MKQESEHERKHLVEGFDEFLLPGVARQIGIHGSDSLIVHHSAHGLQRPAVHVLSRKECIDSIESFLLFDELNEWMKEL